MADETSKPDPKVQDLEKVVAELNSKLQNLEKNSSEATIKISELANAKAALEARLTETRRTDDNKANEEMSRQNFRNKAGEIASSLISDPNIGADRLAEYGATIRNETIKELMPKLSSAVENAVFVERLKDRNPHLVAHENLIRLRVQDIMNSQGKDFKTAASQAITEFNNMIKKEEPKAPPVNPNFPNGAMSDGAPNNPPPVKHEEKAQNEQEDFEEYAKERDSMIKRKALGSK